MKYAWSIMNLALVALSLLGGYSSLDPEVLRHRDPDALFCALVFVGTAVFAVASVGYSIKRWNCDRLPRPSLARNPLNWWFDPLQSLFISTCLAAAMAFGSGVRHPAFGTVAFWMFGFYSCGTAGLIVGQILVYRIYQANIA